MTDTIPATVKTHTALPLSCAHNSWERSTIYDANGYEICAIEISWEADEDTQDHFEALKEANAAFIVRACNSHYQLVESLQTAAAELEYFVEFARKQCEFEGDADAGHSAVRNARAALSQAGGASD